NFVGLYWLASIPVTETIPQGLATFSISVTDVLGNPASAVTTTPDSSAVFIDRILLPILSPGSPSPTRQVSIPVTVTFSEPVNGFSAADVIVTGGEATGLPTEPVVTTSVNFRVRPFSTGMVTIRINAGAVVDATGNSNEPSNVLSVIFQTTTFIEGKNAVSVPVFVDDTFMMSDLGNLAPPMVTVALTGNFANDQDVLGFVGNPVVTGNILGNYDPAAGIL